MKRARKYTDEPIGPIEIIPNFLPPPHELVLREPTTKVTLVLSDSSLTFFKEHAKKSGVPYQRMIRTLLDRYVQGAEVLEKTAKARGKGG